MQNIQSKGHGPAPGLAARHQGAAGQVQQQRRHRGAGHDHAAPVSYTHLDMGIEPRSGSAAELDKQVKSEQPIVSQLIKQANIVLQ